MNQDQHQQPPMTGNDDLAKTLNEGLQFEETPMGGSPAPSGPPPMSTPIDDDLKMPSLAPDAGAPKDDTPTDEPAPSMAVTPPADEPKAEEDDDEVEDDETDEPEEEPAASSTGNSELDGLKASALDELRPLVGKLNLPAEERFDTLLLIIRSTDDQNLLKQAHDAAKEITDDSRRAQALLDVIKEIDYFSNKR